jgi:pyruvate dehydrogenase E1 component
MDIRQDLDPVETKEWIDSLNAVLQHRGPERAQFILQRIVDEARQGGAHLPFSMTTAYKNTIPPEREEKSPGNLDLEHRIRSAIRWNAVSIILNANKESSELGGHIASFQSAAVLYEIGFNHFWRAATKDHGGDMIYFQGHCAPGIYGRAFLEGRLTEAQLRKFRAETGGKGISSYPHPWLMPEFWQFPTVSMGLGPLMAIYQARFLKYLEGRGLAKTEGRKVWAFLGDGECDEPESLGAISLGGREHLDNLIFVINCNLQRLDGPVRGNGKIIQELEAVFRGAGWNVIKVVWGSGWDKLFAKDKDGILLRRMEECVDGQYQDFKSKDGAYVREHFFNTPELKAMVADLTDEQVWKLNRGGHDPAKVYAAYAAAVKHKGQPTLILPKTVKGFGMGESGEGQMIAHQAKKMTADSLKKFRDRFQIPVSDDKLAELPFIKFPDDSPEMKYLKERRTALGGYLPVRRRKSKALEIPPLSTFERLLKSSEAREISTTMAFVQMLNMLVKDKAIGKHVVPIVPDESRTFGMEGMFRALGIFSQVGQLYKPQDADQLMYYREDKAGQVLQEGINEPGAMSSWIAAATSYSSNNVPMIPFYIYYSMFGFQRVGDFIWAAADARCRGFLLGGTAGRTTLAGEGLQHQDGHSHVLSLGVPPCRSYDPAYAYELATIIEDGITRMYGDGEAIFYYLTVMNEQYEMPPMPEGVRDGIIKGLYRFRTVADAKASARAQLIGSGAILNEVIKAQGLLEKYGVAADVWSATSYNELYRDAHRAERWNLLHPGEAARVPYVTECLAGTKGVVVAASDYLKSQPDMIARWVGRPVVTLGTDGFGRSEDRTSLRNFFEVDARHIAATTLSTLARDKQIDLKVVTQAFKDLEINPEKVDPTTV